MCGRYAITLPPQAMREFYRYMEQPNFPARYNVAPTQPVPIVLRGHSGERHFALVRWGLLPGFVKDPKTFPLLVNARAEGIADKASFRAAMRYRRCLFVSDGWYEWRVERATGGKPVKVPYLFRRRDRQPLAMAGLAQTWSDPQGGELETGCPITTAANGETSAIHDRMPALLPDEAVDAWLNTEGVRPQDAVQLLQPAANGVLEFFAVNAAINRATNEGPELQQPAASEPEQAEMLL